MFLSADVISLVLYCAQQLGVTLGVGAQTIMLVAYLSAMRDGVIDPKEAQFVRAVRYVLNAGLVLIIASGLGITALHLLAGQAATIFSEAYLFKWALILGALVFSLLKNFPPKIMQGLAGGSWYALFIVHILAPVASWVNLLTLYVVWMIGFCICWAIAVYTTKEKDAVTIVEHKPAPKPVLPAIKSITPDRPPILKPATTPTPAPAPKPVPPPPPPPPPTPKPVVVTPPANLPNMGQKHISQTLPQPVLPSEQKPVQKIEQNPWLPALHIMPKTESDASKHPANNPLTPPAAK